VAPEPSTDNTVFFRREPELNRGKVASDLHDSGKMFRRLDIARIMPAKDFLFLFEFSRNQGCHIGSPDFQVCQGGETAILSRYHALEYVSPLASVAMRAYAAIDLAKPTARDTMAGRNTVAETRHFRGIGEGTRCRFELLDRYLHGFSIPHNREKSNGFRYFFDHQRVAIGVAVFCYLGFCLSSV